MKKLLERLFNSELTLFPMPSADTIALEQLENARRELLTAHRCREYYESQVRMYQKRISRLTIRDGAV